MMPRVLFIIIIVLLTTLMFALSENKDPDPNPNPVINQPCSCFFNLTKPRADLTLQNYTNKFPGECCWDINPSYGEGIDIYILMIDLFLMDGDNITFYDSCEANSSLPLLDAIHAQDGSFVIVTGRPSICMKLTGPATNVSMRKFEAYYNAKNGSQVCKIQVSPDVKLLKSPMYLNNNLSFDCTYSFKYNTHPTSLATFTFEEFVLGSSSEISIEGSTRDGPFNDKPLIDFFPVKDPLEITMKLSPSANDSFKLRIHEVYQECTKFIKIDATQLKTTITSPAALLNNGSVLNECRWIIFNSLNDILGISFNKLEFNSVLDVVAINNGGSVISDPLIQVTASNRNISTQLIRTAQPYMWISFKPESFVSNFSANITMHGKGGYYKGSGTINVESPAGNDTVFLLEVDADQVVLLNFKASQFASPSMLNIYDDFEPTNLLATLHGNVWYPIVSRTSRMMIITSAFNSGSFSVDFKGVAPGCTQMSTLTSNSYVLSGNCNTTCMWVVPPQDTSNEFLLHLQYLSLEKDDKIELIRLDDFKTPLGTFSSSVTHVPEIGVAANVGVLVKVTRGTCQKSSDVVLVGHVSYVPGCTTDYSVKAPETIQVSSPNYPDTYPILTKCSWNIKVPSDNLVYLAFNKLKLADNHCVTITESVDNKTLSYTGNNLPNDELINGSVVIRFDSTNCGSSKGNLTLTSDEGFLINATIADCGGILTTKTGQFNITDVKTKKKCIWKISIPETESDKSVNIIMFNVAHHDDSGDLAIYDGASVRDDKITNFTSGILSRTNNLIVTYTLESASKGFSLNYTTKNCNVSMQCANKICMHPDWLCNGKNECGDFSDEKYCGSAPPPPPPTPDVKNVGFSSTTYGLSVFAFFILGVVFALAGPFVYQRYCRGQYRRFGDISVIE